MSREHSPYVVGDFWLDKRRDGKSPAIWQITTYDERRRQVVYRSTHSKDLEDAKERIHAYAENARSQRPQKADEAHIVANLLVYWNEHARHTIKPGVIAGSLRAFIGFLEDQNMLNALISDLNPVLFSKFTRWRMAPHSYEIPWEGKIFRVDSDGVKGESVSRNLDDIRAALNHQAANGRIPYAPKVPSVPAKDRSPPRDRVLTYQEVGRIVCIAGYTPAMFRRVCLVLATAVRPEAAFKMDPAAQYQPEHGLLDLHPVGAPRTKKHNPVVPVIPEFAPILEAWGRARPMPISEAKTAWRTLRRLAGLGSDVHLKTIRHTVATLLRGMGVQRDEVESLLGHSIYRGSSAVYAKYDPNYLVAAKAALSTIFRRVMAEAHAWGAVHILSKVGNDAVKVLARNDENAKLYKPGRLVGGDGIEPPTRSV